MYNEPAIYADTLKPGDKFNYRDTVVTVLRDAEPWTDPFGRSEGFIKLWCAADGREGFMQFGPGGYV